MGHSAQIVPLFAQRLAYDSMPLESAKTAFSKVRSAKRETPTKQY